MGKTYKYRLMPSSTMEKKLHGVLTRCRELSNAGLSERRDAYHVAGQSITDDDQHNDLPEIKAQIREEYQQIADHVLQDVCQRLNKAFQRLFDRVKKGQKAEYPRFQGRTRYDSFIYPDGAGWKLQAKPESKRASLRLTTIRTIRVKRHRPMVGAVKTVTIKREGEHRYVCFSCEIEKPEALPVSYEDGGIDVGLTHCAALSNGECIESPRSYRKAEKKLKALQESLSRKKQGLHRRARAVKRVAKSHHTV
jgi:putative transposase